MSVVSVGTDQPGTLTKNRVILRQNDVIFLWDVVGFLACTTVYHKQKTEGKILLCVTIIAHGHFLLLQAVQLSDELKGEAETQTAQDGCHATLEEYENHEQNSEICDSSCLMVKSLNTHNRIYSCDVCKNVFSHETELREHLVVHSVKCLYSCDICKKAFNLYRTGCLKTGKPRRTEFI
jgi:hypothetical protein